MSTLASTDQAIVLAQIRLEMLRARRADLVGDRAAASRCSTRLYVLERRRQNLELELAEKSALNEVNGGHVDA